MNKNITIGITAYNEGQYLQEAWDSVANQCDEFWEAIMILDGGSDLETEKVFDDISHPSLRKTMVPIIVEPWQSIIPILNGIVI